MQISSSKHDRIFDILEIEARDVMPVGRSRHASAIVYRNEILGIGINSKRSHPFQKRFCRHEDAIYLHSETDALQRVIRTHGIDILSKCAIYVCRMKYIDGQKDEMIRGMSKPCKGCTRALSTFGISKVYFTCGEEGYDRL
jgi:tRNA(Arg) A34 adenosine deaminase TadA